LQPAIANAPLPAEGNGSFNNIHLGLLVFFTPAVLLRVIPFVKASWFGWTAYFFLVLVTGLPITVAYWTIMSQYGPRKNTKVQLPNKPIETYLTFNDPRLKEKYSNKKIPMEHFHELYFDGKIDIKGDMLDVLEHRLDWSLMHMTPELFKFVLTVLVPDVLTHSAKADEDMVRDHYDRGNDFYEWFLGPQMIYTSGMISDATKKESLEELQTNKLATVCDKLGLKAGDKLLDIGCGWGTLTAFAAKNYGVDATGVTLAREQTKFGNDRIALNGLSKEEARILCMDYRDIPVEKGHYDKIVSLEMAEHVGIRHYSRFLNDIYERLNDDGTFLLQVAGLRPCWQYWDLIWGIFMNKYIFRGADGESFHSDDE
jgi:cyclopropane fatty-acyl-phospholipid synthase-like methyltransferase